MSGMYERKLVLDHALLSEENLDIALTIAAVYDEICSQVFDGFITSLGTELSSRLGKDWKIATGSAGEMVVVQAPGHAANVYVALSADEGGRPRYPYFAVRCKNREALLADKAKQIKAALDAQYGQGKATDYSLWWRPVDKKYADWNSPETLIRLYRKKEALIYFAGHLEKLGTVLKEVLCPQLSVKNQKRGPR
jgi:hypothetical protein